MGVVGQIPSFTWAFTSQFDMSIVAFTAQVQFKDYL